MKKELIRLKVLQMVIDVLLILTAFALAYFLRIGFYFSTEFPFNQYMTIALVTTPITVLFMFFARTYKLTQQIVSWRHFQRIGFVSVVNVAVFMVLYYFTYRNFFSRLILVYIFFLTLFLVYGWHVVFRKIMQLHSRREIGVYRALIIGSNRPAQDFIRMMIENQSHIKPVAVIDAYGSSQKSIHGVPVVGKMNLFEKTIADHDIDIIVQADSLEQTLNIINYALQNNIKYIIPPELLGVFQGHQTLEEIEGQPYLKIYPKKQWWHQICKFWVWAVRR